MHKIQILKNKLLFSLFFCFEEPELDVRSHYAAEIVARNKQIEEEVEEGKEIEAEDEEMEVEDEEMEVEEEEIEKDGDQFSPEVTKFLKILQFKS